jgi:hypothetical protein
MDLEQRFDDLRQRYSDNFFFAKNKRSNRKDLHAFLLLDELMPSGKKIISGISSDGYEIYLDVDIDDLNAIISDDQIIELIRCGVMCDGNSLSMFA